MVTILFVCVCVFRCVPVKLELLFDRSISVGLRGVLQLFAEAHAGVGTDGCHGFQCRHQRLREGSPVAEGTGSLKRHGPTRPGHLESWAMVIQNKNDRLELKKTSWMV